MLGPVLASIAFGFAKGLTSTNRPSGVRFVRDVMGPVREEVVYRATPLSGRREQAFGSTAATFAADHTAHDMRYPGGPTTPGELVGRFGDVLLGGLLYESAYRSSGLAGAVIAHVAHNVAVSLGERLAPRRRR